MLDAILLLYKVKKKMAPSKDYLGSRFVRLDIDKVKLINLVGQIHEKPEMLDQFNCDAFLAYIIASPKDMFEAEKEEMDQQMDEAEEKKRKEEEMKLTRQKVSYNLLP